MASAQVRDQFPVGGPCVQFLVAPAEGVSQVDDLLFKQGDALLQVVDVSGCAHAGLAPSLFAEQFGEPVFQVPDVGGMAGDLAVTVGSAAGPFYDTESRILCHSR